MKLHVSTGGYENQAGRDRGLLLMGDPAVQIYERWRRLYENNATVADADHGRIKYAMTVVR